ncbi:MAG TPA: LapA family protein [Bauldia sp.]|nr:LapA family protein [Bauldia sp.]
MRRFLVLIILIPLAVVIVFFSVANRDNVTVSLDPFSTPSPALFFTAPLFVVLFGALVLGLLIGGIATWVRQGRWRRAARNAESEAERLRVEAGRARSGATVAMLPPTRDAA